MIPEEAVATYGSAWSETDDDRRMEILERCWAPDGLYVDPSGSARGPEALSKLIAGFQTTFAGHRMELASGVDAHDGYLRFAWKMYDPDGAELMEGCDFGHLDGEGRIDLICGFFGPWPEVPG